MNASSALTNERSRIHRLGLASAFAVLVSFGVAGCGSSNDSAKATTTTSTAAGGGV